MCPLAHIRQQQLHSQPFSRHRDVGVVLRLRHAPSTRRSGPRLVLHHSPVDHHHSSTRRLPLNGISPSPSQLGRTSSSAFFFVPSATDMLSLNVIWMFCPGFVLFLSFITVPALPPLLALLFCGRLRPFVLTSQPCRVLLALELTLPSSSLSLPAMSKYFFFLSSATSRLHGPFEHRYPSLALCSASRSLPGPRA